ncbi:MAG: copper chaperone PCu(A)C, partial [Actinobacteria bacterium]|nr:copper chaperone PCu(A)C [Actinomycetota bacterium]
MALWNRRQLNGTRSHHSPQQERDNNMKTKLAGIIASVALVVGVTACSSDDAATPDSPEITVTSQWARQSHMATDMGAAYMIIESDAEDELVGASVDMSVAMMTEVHETVTVDGGMKMQEVSSIKVTPEMPIEM